MNPKNERPLIIERPKAIEKPVEQPKALVEQPQSLVEQMRELKEVMNQVTQAEAKKSKKKTFKIPLKVKAATRDLKKMMDRNKVQVIMLKSTGDISLTLGEINAGRLIVGDMYWNATGDITWGWLGKVRTAIICDWDIEPVSRKRLMAETSDMKSWMHPQVVTIRAVMAKIAEERKTGLKLNPMMLVVIGIVVIVAYYIFFG